MSLLGMVCGGALFALAPWLSTSALEDSAPSPKGDATHSVWLAVGGSFCDTDLRVERYAEAQQNFVAVNALRVGLVYYISWPTYCLAILAKSCSCGTHVECTPCQLWSAFIVCKRGIPAFSRELTWDRHSFRELLGYGSWDYGK